LRAFISYANQNRDVARHLADVLRDEGIEPWVAFADLRAGEAFRSALPRAIEAADVVLFVIGREPSGPWQDFERQAAVQAVWDAPSKGLVPVLLPEATLPPFLGTWAGIRLSADHSQWTSAFRKLARDLKSNPIGTRRAAGNWDELRRRLAAVEVTAQDLADDDKSGSS
jgi:TIR domain